MNLYVWVKWIGNSIWQMIWSINTRGSGHVFKCLITEMSTENGVALPTSIRRFRLFLFYVCSLASFARELLGHTSSRIRSIFSFCASLITLARTTLQSERTNAFVIILLRRRLGMRKCNITFWCDLIRIEDLFPLFLTFFCYCRRFTAFLDVCSDCCFYAIIYLFIYRKFSLHFFFRN